MTKIRLNNTHRDVLITYGREKIESLIDRTQEKALYAILLSGANKAIRVKYPEEHMAILRRYDCARKDLCLKFQFPSGSVDGFYFKQEDDLMDLPCRGGCYSDDVFPVDAGFEEAHGQYNKVAAAANRKELEERTGTFRSFIYAAKTLDDVVEAIDLPVELQERLGKKSQALVALNDDTLKQLKRDFSLVDTNASPKATRNRRAA